MLKKFSFVSLIAIFAGLSSCETEFSLNGEYELTPVVFGLLDHTDSIHIIKITKAYLGDGDNLVYAQNPDSNYFKQVDARIFEINTSGDKTGRQWVLQDSIITNKSTDGVFYAPEQKIYFFKEADLESEMTYELIVDVNEGALNFSSQTNMINQFAVPSVIKSPIYKIRFANNTVDETKDYLAWGMNISPGYNAGKFEVGYTFHWTEHYIDETSASFSAKKRELTESDLSASNSSVYTILSGLNFYKWVQEVVPDDDNVDYRTADGFDLHVSVAHNNLKEYISVGQPVSGIAQVQPVFTNIIGGYGLFSSRLLYTLPNMVLNEASIKELARGQFTFSKGFCSSYPLHSSEEFYCP